MTAVLHPWRSGRLWRSLVHATLDVPVGMLITIPTGIGVILTLALAITLPFALVPFTGVVLWTRWMGRLERSRAAALLETPLADPVARLPKGSPWVKVKALVRDRARWRQLFYCLLRLPLGAVIAFIVLTAWTGSFALVALPAYVAALPRDAAQFGVFAASQGPAAWALAVAGLAGCALVAPWLTILAGRLDAALASWLLGPPDNAALVERAERAETGRTAAIGAAEVERRRIERDLHDGAQQRLVALAVDLGTARERLETDPEGAKALVAEAHTEARRHSRRSATWCGASTR